MKRFISCAVMCLVVSSLSVADPVLLQMELDFGLRYLEITTKPERKSYEEQETRIYS